MAPAGAGMGEPSVVKSRPSLLGAASDSPLDQGTRRLSIASGASGTAVDVVHLGRRKGRLLWN